MNNQEKIIEKIKFVLFLMPNKPFLCLQFSTVLHEELTKIGFLPKLIVGDLSYKNEIIFKMNYSLNDKIKQNNKSLIIEDWDGHAWVELENLIIDLSIFRTIYSNKFNKKCKNEIIDKIGTGKGCLIIEDKNNNETGFIYYEKDELNQNTIDGILRGVPLIFD